MQRSFRSSTSTPKPPTTAVLEWSLRKMVQSHEVGVTQFVQIVKQLSSIPPAPARQEEAT